MEKSPALLFFEKREAGSEGTIRQLIDLVLEMKRRNPQFGCTKIADQISKTFALSLDKDVVRRILASHYQPDRTGGPSWLAFMGHMKDSLWSLDFFRCESLQLKTHWVLVVMDQCTNRLIGFGVHPAPAMDGQALCRLFHQITSGNGLPQCLNSDHDPVFRFHQCQGTLRILGIRAVKTLPCVPISHPFIERLIGTIRREYLDHMLFWNASDLERKLEAFKAYYNGYRIHQSLPQQTPEEAAGKDPPATGRTKAFCVAVTLSGIVSDPNGRIIRNSPCTGKIRQIPLNSLVQGIFVDQGSRSEPELCDRIFANDPRFLRRVFDRAVKMARLAPFRFHDLRHTFASRLAMQGCNDRTIMELGGWGNPRMLKRYAHLGPAHLWQAVEGLTRSQTGSKTGSREGPQVGAAV